MSFFWNNINDSEQDEVNRHFENFKKSGYTDEDRSSVFENEGMIRAKSEKGPLKEFAETIALFFDMLKAFFSGTYKTISITSISVIIGVLLYVLSPIDIAPDIIPVLGLVDDAFMVGLAIKFLAKDISKYKEYKQARQVILDGSNIALYVNNGRNTEKIAKLENINIVTDYLASKGYSVIKLFVDANLRYLDTSGMSFEDFEYSYKHELVEVPGGTRADEFLINYAKRNDAIIVTNDQFRDHIESGILTKEFYDTHHFLFVVVDNEPYIQTPSGQQI